MTVNIVKLESYKSYKTFAKEKFITEVYQETYI